MTDETKVLDSVPTGLLIGGEWRSATGGRTFVVEDPATRRELVQVADATAEDALAALGAAAEAQRSWAATPPRVRAEILRSAFDVMTERAATPVSSASITPLTSASEISADSRSSSRMRPSR